MSLATNVTNLAIRVATEAKSLRALVNGNTADLSSLSTTAKSNLVAAINELHAAIASASSINDSTTSTSTSWSSTKTAAQINAAISSLIDTAPGTLDTLNELAAAIGDDPNFAATMTTALGNRVRVDAAQSLTGPQQAQARANIGAGTSNVVVGNGSGQAADGAATATALAGKAPTSHTHTAAQVSDTTATGRAVMTAADAAAARTAIGAGAPYSLPSATETTVGGAEVATTAEVTTGTDDARIVTPKKFADRLAAVLTGYSQTGHNHTASEISDATTVGRNVLKAADAAAARTAIGAGTPYTLPAASESAVGGAEIATTAEVTAGTDNGRIVSPKGLADRIGVVIGNPETDFAAQFEAGLV